MTGTVLRHARKKVQAWAGNNALHALAYVALRLTSPVRARDWVVRAAELYPRLRTIDEARELESRLGSWGTCLTRSLVVAARCAPSEIVIGVADPSKGPTKSGRALDAHAWVVLDGVPLTPASTTLWVEVGRLDVHR
jgi:Transglutaminase-like superfamily